MRKEFIVSVYTAGSGVVHVTERDIQEAISDKLITYMVDVKEVS